MRRFLLILLLLVVGLLAAAALAFYWATRPLPVLTVTTWPGPYGRAQAAALMRPYAAARGLDVRIANWDGELDELAKAVASRSYNGDVFDFELPTAVEACARGLLEKIDATTLPPGADGTPAARDFIPGAIGPCWVGSVAYSQAIIFAPEKFAGKFTGKFTGKFAGAQPSTVADFFDTKRFPGPRALKRASAKFNLELALLADGVAPGDVYGMLGTDAGVTRALQKLDTLKPAIVWWRGSGEPVDLIRNGDAVFATVLNSAIYEAGRHANKEHGALGVIWDRQLYEMDVFGIPAGDPKRKQAMDFIRFATGAAPLAAVASWVPFGPVRRSALPLVGSNPELGIAMRPWLPTAPANFATAFAVDDTWWRSHGAAVGARWQAWLATSP